MEKQKHSIEPWSYGDGSYVLDANGDDVPFNNQNIRRYVACVNACAGIENPAEILSVIEVLDLLELATMEGTQEFRMFAAKEARAALAALKGGE